MSTLCPFLSSLSRLASKSYCSFFFSAYGIQQWNRNLDRPGAAPIQLLESEMLCVVSFSDFRLFLPLSLAFASKIICSQNTALFVGKVSTIGLLNKGIKPEAAPEPSEASVPSTLPFPCLITSKSMCENSLLIPFILIHRNQCKQLGMYKICVCG